MIIIDTGPLVALFDPKDPDHNPCHLVLDQITSPLCCTEAVLTEVLHMLDAGSRGIQGIKEFILNEYLHIYSLTHTEILSCFDLMEKYSDLPMDFADGSLLVIAERFHLSKIFTLDFKDFSAYRFTKGHKNFPFELLGREMLE